MTDHREANVTGEIGRGTARIASATALRTALSMGLSAATAAVIARALGAGEFGVYAGGTAAFYLAISLTDLGFAMALARELATRPGDAGRLLRATVQVQVLWSVAVALGLLVAALAAGGTRGRVMLILAPAVVFSGLGASRQIFTVRYRAAPLLVLDILSALGQAAALIALAAVGAGPVLLAVALAGAISLNVVVAAVLAHRAIDSARPQAGDRAQMFRLALPVGIPSVLASLYFSIDLVLLGWLVASRQLGHYAAAVRFLTALVAIPGLVMAAGVPGLARSASDRGELSRFAGTLAHWLAVTALPLCVGLIVFAGPAVRVVFGSSYHDAAGLLRVLMVAGLVILANNVLAMVLISIRALRRMVLVSLISLIANVAGNVVLVPRYGVSASAWLTVLSEVIVLAYAVGALRHRLDYGTVAARSWRAVSVTLAAGAVGLALGPGRPYAAPAAAGVLAVGLLVLRAWPAELLPERLRWLAAPVAVR